jgi:hypothetical protein
LPQPSKNANASAEPPILVVGPTTRCGTSLLQRLLNSTGEVVIYGENFSLMQTVPDIIRNQQRGADGKRKVIGIARDMVRQRVDFEASSLFPDFDGYIRAWRAAFDGLVRFYREDAARLGFARWGLKHQIRAQSSFALLPKLLPEARYVMIYRDLLAVARSAKARWPDDFKGADDYRRFGRNWQDNVHTMRGFAGDNFLLFRYEDFVADPGPHLERLERFVGFEGIDREVMTRKINDQPAYELDRGKAGAADYREPARLTGEEIELLLADSAALYRELGYEARR